MSGAISDSETSPPGKDAQRKPLVATRVQGDARERFERV